ncbi:MAG: DUF4393 domain-containing protein [Methanothrix sp.]|nr:DUF4393 domain-containing protein [Methanothrix sp.]
MADIMGIGDALNSKVVEKAYDDAISKAAKQFGEFGEDFLKTARLVLFPFQMFAAMQDRLERTLKRVCDVVPPERRITPPPLQIIGPIFENIKYMDDNNILYELFEELLAHSIDSDRIEEAHPSFIHIISQLSHDEAIILFELKKNDFEVVDTLDLDHEKNRFVNRKIEKTTIPVDKLFSPNKAEMYYSHLESLSLVEWPVIKQEPIKDGDRQIGIRRHSKMNLTEFGKFFVNACVPEGGFRNK